MWIYSLVSDSEIREEFLFSLKNRNLEQKFLYHKDGSDLYYDYKYGKDKIMNIDIFESENIPNFWNKNCFFNENKKILISLWCGNSSIEKNIYNNISTPSKLEFIGVDISKEMLYLSEKTLKDVSTTKTFVCADFSSVDFKNEINNLTYNGNKRIFSFFSNTFWNINHTNIIDTLYDILKKGDQIWLDVRLRKSNSIKDDMEIFNLVEIKWLEKFLSNPFSRNDIPLDNWYISKEMEKEEWINSLKVKFYFNFTKKTSLNIRSQITFLPWESIRCLQVYYYDPDKLINFFEEHNFKFIDKEIKWMRWQFLFEKQ